MKLHVLGLPFSETTRAWEHCAFSARTRTFCTMMHEAGYEVILYAGEHNEASVTEHVALTDPHEQQLWWPDYVPQRDVFNDFDPNGVGWRTFNNRAFNAILERAESGDVLCATMGRCQQAVASALPSVFAVETGIGYSGVFAPYRVFESWAWRHYLQAREPTDDVRFYDEVVPRAYEVEDFPAGNGNGGYALFIGRLTARKGPHIAAMAAQRAGVPLVVAGQGIATEEPGKLTCTDGTVLEGDVTYAGVLGPEARAKVMGDASCVLVPTMYLEPFGGVSVVAQLCGTPAVCSSWGGLVENVEHNGSGFLCSTLSDFASAIENAPSLSRGYIRNRAQGIWSTQEIGGRFRDYFTRLSELRGEGWYAA